MTSIPPPRPVADLAVEDLAAARALFAGLGFARREIAAVAYLDPKWRLLGMRHIAGGGDRVAIALPTLARDCFAFGAVAVVVAHNHPSGEATPSADDLACTRALGGGLRAIGVRLIDHLVLAGDACTSVRAAGLL